MNRPLKNEELRETKSVVTPLVKNAEIEAAEGVHRSIDEIAAEIAKLPLDKKKALIKILKKNDRPVLGSDIACGPG